MNLDIFLVALTVPLIPMVGDQVVLSPFCHHLAALSVKGGTLLLFALTLHAEAKATGIPTIKENTNL